MKWIAKDHVQRFSFEKNEVTYNGQSIQGLSITYSVGGGLDYVLLRMVPWFPPREDIVVMIHQGQEYDNSLVPNWVVFLIAKYAPSWFLENK